MSTDLFDSGAVAASLAPGPLVKMPVRVEKEQAMYRFQAGGEALELNPWLGHRLRLRFTGVIRCQYCGQPTRKSFQGFCYEHFRSLAQADSCIVSPEKCHFEQGTCREPEWGEKYCFQTHYVYLANTGQPKVGITRATQLPTRWVDQGAESALPIARVRSRYLAGLLESHLRQHIGDKTNWRKMLAGSAAALDLAVTRDELLQQAKSGLDDLLEQFGLQAIQILPHASSYTVIYPVQTYPGKIVSFNFDKAPEVSGTLLGIKGQYLILDTGVINIRRYTGYETELSILE